MNVVPVHAPDTLPIIFERGLVGTYHDWCEPFSTYPRSYDLLHADHLFSRLKNRYRLATFFPSVAQIKSMCSHFWITSCPRHYFVVWAWKILTCYLTTLSFWMVCLGVTWKCDLKHIENYFLQVQAAGVHCRWDGSHTKAWRLGDNTWQGWDIGSFGRDFEKFELGHQIDLCPG